MPDSNVFRIGNSLTGNSGMDESMIHVWAIRCLFRHLPLSQLSGSHPAEENAKLYFLYKQCFNLKLNTAESGIILLTYKLNPTLLKFRISTIMPAGHQECL